MSEVWWCGVFWEGFFDEVFFVEEFSDMWDISWFGIMFCCLNFFVFSC